ncbi:hypothetical protein [Chryseobacterium populi]|uniref:Uncharacterized protein n=1 Tax=Chryseobacterium populi TaxID=1144316 RepID=J2JWD9_9FLAO|nr:hypothetical protein [Chryseobacterium populi]EJL72165.1 hypothetical protein PMI13_02003 [Chryseobacterium populi]
MKTQTHIALKKLSKKEQSAIIAGGTSLNVGDDPRNGTGGGTNNGGGSGNVIDPCVLISITECLFQNKCTKEYVRTC